MSARLTYTSGSAAPETDKAFEAALAAARGRPDEPLPHVVGGAASFDGPAFERRDPSRTAAVASRAHEAPAGLVAEAVERARAAQPEWRRTGVAERCAALRLAGAAIAERHMELAAAVTLETGKSRTESIAEVQEAVDLIEAYCEQIERHAGFEVELGQLTPEETNRSVLRPFGVFGVIGPFNFPVALVTGMASGALVAGNTVVIKPSEQTPLSGALVGEAFAAAGLPDGVVGLVHGGAATGGALAEGAIDGVVFTGSADVGRALARRFQEGRFARPAITEMGGKNPAIVSDKRRPRGRRGRHRGVRIRLLGPEVQRLLARDRARRGPRRAGRAAGRTRRRARRRRPRRPRRVHGAGRRRARRRALRRGVRGGCARRRRRGRRARARPARPLRRARGRDRPARGAPAHARGAVRPVRHA